MFKININQAIFNEGHHHEKKQNSVSLFSNLTLYIQVGIDK